MIRTGELFQNGNSITLGTINQLFKNNLDNSGTQDEATKEKVKHHSDINDNVLWVSKVGAKVWYKLAHWAKTKRRFKPDERFLLFNIGKKLSIKKLPSQNQAKKGKKLLKKAISLGFKVR
jgi:hypothetical protein